MANETRGRVALGEIIPVVFWATLLLCGFMYGEYDHLRRLVSELGAIGAPSQDWFMAGLLACAALSVFFVVGLTRACRARGISPLPAWIVLSFSVSLAGAALFPLPLNLHLWAGMPSILLLLSPLAALILWRRDRRPAGVTLLALAVLVLFLLGATVFLPEIMSSLPGLKQRFFHLGWSLWFIGLARAFRRQAKEGSRP
jgi:hypothetical membrane protein